MNLWLLTSTSCRNQFISWSFVIGKQFSMIRKVIFDDRHLLQVLSPFMQARQTAGLYNFHPHGFFYALNPVSHHSIWYVHQIYSFTSEELLVSEALTFQDFQNFLQLFCCLFTFLSNSWEICTKNGPYLEKSPKEQK